MSLNILGFVESCCKIANDTLGQVVISIHDDCSGSIGFVKSKDNFKMYLVSFNNEYEFDQVLYFQDPCPSCTPDYVCKAHDALHILTKSLVPIEPICKLCDSPFKPYGMVSAKAKGLCASCAFTVIP